MFACPSLRSRLASSGTDYPSDDLRGGARCPARLKNRVVYGIDVHMLPVRIAAQPARGFREAARGFWQPAVALLAAAGCLSGPSVAR